MSSARPAPRRRALPVAAAMVVGALALAVTATSADAQDADDEPAGSLSLTLAELSGVLGPGSVPPPAEDLDPDGLPETPQDLELRVLVENDGDTSVDNLQVVTEVYGAADSRRALHRAFEGDLGGAPLHVHLHQVRDGDVLGPGEVAGVEDVFTRDEVSWADGGGVHPVRVAVQRGTEVLDEVVTAAVWLSETPGDPLLTTVVWPVDDVPWRTTGGAYPATADRTLEPGGRLDVLVRTLERRPDAPVVLAVAPHLLEDLRDRAGGYTAVHRRQDGSMESRTVEPEDAGARASNDLLQRLRDLAASLPHAPVVSAYADADLAALLAEGEPLADLAAEAAAESRRRLQDLLDRPPDRSTHLVGGAIDGRTVDLLRSEHLLLPYDTVDGPDPDTASDLPAPLRPLRSEAGGLLTGIVADPYLTAALDEPDGGAGPAVDAQRIIADTAMAYLDAPRHDGRTLLVLPPEVWAPDPLFAREVLAGLLDATWLEPTDPSDQAARGRTSSGHLALAAHRVEPADPDFASRLQDALLGLEAVAAALPPERDDVGGRHPGELRDALLRATSRRYEGPGRAEALSLVRDVARAVDVTFGDVVIASGSRVTLTSDAGQIPVTLHRTRGGPIAVQLEVASHGRLVWPEGRWSDSILLEEGEVQTVSFDTRALSTGTFPVTVRVTDPSGWYELDRTTLSVRSQNVSGPALAGIAGAVVLLILLGLLRRRRPRLALIPPDGTDPDPPASRHPPR